MRIVKHIRSIGRNPDFFIADSGRGFILEWSFPEREQSGRSSHHSMAAAMVEASRLFGIAPESWYDGDPFKCPPWRRKDQPVAPENEASLLPDVWELFSWSAPQLPRLVSALQVELTHRRARHEEEDVRSNDPDERSSNRAWCDELAATLRRWCGLLEINPDDLPGYRKALRQNVWNEDLIPTDAIPPTVLVLLQSRVGADDLVFRPLCLEQAHTSLLDWLQRHPSDVDRVHHRTFEAIVAETIRTAGWSVELTKQTRDGGYDIMCLQNDRAGFPLKMIVETKLYSLDRPVGLPMVDRLIGVRDREHANRAVLVTNSRFTNVTWALWKNRVRRDLRLVEREELFDWLSAGRAKM